MITFVELGSKLNALAGEIENYEQGQLMAELGLEARRLIFDRITGSGENAEGAKFPAYSTTPMLAGKKSFKTDKAFNRIAGSKDKRRELKWISIGSGEDIKRLFFIPGGYKEFRDLHGRQSAFVDFSFTNEMWNNIKVKSTPADHQDGLAIIGATKDIEKKKLEGNTERKGDILKLNKDEIRLMVWRYETRLQKIINKHGLA